MTIPVLTTERLTLRALREGDFEAFAAFYGDPASAMIGGPLPKYQAWRLFTSQLGQWLLRGHGSWAIEADGLYCGGVGLNRPFDWPELEVGWWLLPQARRRGYATEAARAARLFARDTLGATTLVSYIDPDNAASRQVAQRLGARHETTIELRGEETHVFRHPPAETWH